MADILFRHQYVHSLTAHGTKTNADSINTLVGTSTKIVFLLDYGVSKILTPNEWKY